MRRPIVADMLTIAFALLCLVIAIFRTATDLRLEIFALRHQLGVLRRQRPGRPHLVRGDRILWVWLYRLWPRCLQALLIVKPATVIRWHRAGFGLYWHWRSKLRRTGRPSVDREIRDLIRQMSQANPLWGAPRIHGELLKLGICIGQTAVAKYMIRSLRPLSPNWPTFLRNLSLPRTPSGLAYRARTDGHPRLPEHPGRPGDQLRGSVPRPARAARRRPGPVVQRRRQGLPDPGLPARARWRRALPEHRRAGPRDR